MQLISKRILYITLLGAWVTAPVSGADMEPTIPLPNAPIELPVIPQVPSVPLALPTAPAMAIPLSSRPLQNEPKDKDPEKDDKDKDDKVEDIIPVIESGPLLSLGECIAIALERQPSLKAARASSSATTVGYESLLKIGKVGNLLSPDLDIRKQQAQQGLLAACAEIQKAQNEILQDVTRLYYSVVYAKQQELIGADVAGQLKELIAIAWKLLEDTPNPKDLEGLTKGKILAMESGLLIVQQKIAEARIGRLRAIAALRQVMAVNDQEFTFQVKDVELPLMAQKVPVTKELVVQQALCRRPELALAAAGVDAFRLEVYAQAKIPFRKVVPTFASGSDLHAKDIPQADRGKDYRPGGISPELPPQLVGSKFDRVRRAMEFSQRADAVFDSARSLITLEAENGYLELLFATQKLKYQKKNLELALDIQKTAREQAPNTKDKSITVQAEVFAAKAQSDYVEAVFQHLLALSALERITAGGISPAFPGR